MAGLDPDFTLLIDSANGLKVVNLFSIMNVYAVAWVEGDPHNGNQKTQTPVVKDGGTNPKWKGHPISFTVSKDPLLHDRLTLNIKLVSERTLIDTKIGKAKIPLKELLDGMGGGDAKENQIKYVCREVRPQGTINFRYKFGNKFWVAEPQNNSQDPVMGSPVGYPGSSFGYAPASSAGAYPPAQAYSHPPPGAYAPPPHQRPGYGHPPPLQAGYAYGHAPQPGHGYPVQQVLQGAALFASMGNNVLQMADAGFGGGYDAGFGGVYDAGFGGGYDAGFGGV